MLKKIASIFFSIDSNQPAWPQICAADHRGLNVVTIYLMFFFFCSRLVGKHSPWLFPVFFFSSIQIFKWFCSAPSKKKKNKKAHGEWDRVANKTNETIIPFAFGLSWICIRITIYYYCYYCTIFILSDEPEKKLPPPFKKTPSKSTVLDGHPDRNIDVDDLCLCAQQS